MQDDAAGLYIRTRTGSHRPRPADPRLAGPRGRQVAKTSSQRPIRRYNTWNLPRAAKFKLGESMGVFMEKPMLTELLTSVE